VIQNLRNQNESLQTHSVDLMNRIQAEDFRTYAALTSVANPIPDYDVKPKTDANELAQLIEAGGLGEAIYDDDSAGEFSDTLADLGYKD
jgi:hypothetical protein